MALSFQIMNSGDIPEILDYEYRKLSETIPNENDRNMFSWNSRWKKESLEHYAKMGWSVVVRDSEVKSTLSNEGVLMGYLLAQPFAYMDGQDQMLWIEHIQYSSLQARDELCDMAVKTARDKHFQKVIFPNIAAIKNSIKQMKGEEWQPNLMQILTTKV